jgi:hypothetical protein
MQPARGPISAQRRSLRGLVAYERCQAERVGWPMADTARCGARLACGHCGHVPRSGAADGGWPLLVAGLGKVTGGGAHPSGAWQGDRQGSSPEWHLAR